MDARRANFYAVLSTCKNHNGCTSCSIFLSSSRPFGNLASCPAPVRIADSKYICQRNNASLYWRRHSVTCICVIVLTSFLQIYVNCAFFFDSASSIICLCMSASSVFEECDLVIWTCAISEAGSIDLCVEESPVVHQTFPAAIENEHKMDGNAHTVSYRPTYGKSNIRSTQARVAARSKTLEISMLPAAIPAANAFSNTCACRNPIQEIFKTVCVHAYARKNSCAHLVTALRTGTSFIIVEVVLGLGSRARI